MSRAAAVEQDAMQELQQLSEIAEAMEEAKPVKTAVFTADHVLQQYAAAMLRILTPARAAANRARCPKITLAGGWR